MLEQFNEFSSLNCALSSYQLAYKSGHSYQTAILKIINDILWAMERKEITALVMIDLLAAFDTVDIEILLQILKKKFGLCDTVLRWFMSYMKNQKCKLCIGNDYSEIITFNFSVAQGGHPGTT